MPADVIIYMNALWWSACQPELNNSRLKCGRAARSHKLSRNQQYIHRTRCSCTVCAITSICARQWEPCVYRIVRNKKKKRGKKIKERKEEKENNERNKKPGRRVRVTGGESRGWNATTRREYTPKIGIKFYLLHKPVKWEYIMVALFLHIEMLGQRRCRKILYVSFSIFSLSFQCNIVGFVFAWSYRRES